MPDSRPHLVVFGAGYVGSALAREALARGWRVSALTRNAVMADGLARLGATPVVADLATADWHADIAGPADLIVNCVSSGRLGLEGYQRSYVEGMRSVMRWAQERKPGGVLVYTSSTSVYPQGDGACVTESSVAAPITGRGRLLLEAERVLTDVGLDRGSAAAARADRGFSRAVVLRLAGIYGPGRHYLLDEVRAGCVAGTGEHRLNLIHRDDICAAIWSVFGAVPPAGDEVFNVADDAPTPKSEVVRWLAGRLGVPVPLFSGEPAPGRSGITPDRSIANRRLRDRVGWRPRFPSFREGYENILSRTAD